MIDFYNLEKGFLEQIQLKNISPETIRTLFWTLKRFKNYINIYDLSHIGEINSEHIKEYRKYSYNRENRQGKRDCVEVQNNLLWGIKSFFKYLKEEEIIISNPLENIEFAKEPKRLPKPALTNQEMKNMLSKPNTQNKLGYRDKTILELLYSTGIRNAELTNLKIQDVNYIEGFLRINQGKGRKDRVVPIGKIASKYLENYLKGIRMRLGKKEQALFLSYRGNKLCGSNVLEMIKKYAKMAKIDKHVTTHTFRRTCATGMIRNKANIMHVKEILGHSSMDAIQAYCDLTILDLKEAHKKCHPREQN